MFYTTMTDQFLSGWGLTKNKTSKLVITCDTLEKAEIIAKNAKKRDEMKFVNICVHKPYYNKKYYHTSYKSFEDLGSTWTKKEV